MRSLLFDEGFGICAEVSLFEVLSRKGFLVKGPPLKDSSQGGCRRVFLWVEIAHVTCLLYFMDVVEFH